MLIDLDSDKKKPIAEHGEEATIEVYTAGICHQTIFGMGLTTITTAITAILMPQTSLYRIIETIILSSRHKSMTFTVENVTTHF